LDAQFRRRLYLGSVFIRRSSPRPSVRPPSSRAGPLEGPCHPLGLVQTRSQTLAGPTVPAGVAADLPTAAAAISDTATAAAFAGSGDADTEAEAAWVANCDHHRVGGACCGWYRWRRLIERWHDSHGRAPTVVAANCQVNRPRNHRRSRWDTSQRVDWVLKVKITDKQCR
jgi:hypothetical protein